MSNPVSKKEVETIKLLISRGFHSSEIRSITNRSKETVRRVARGEFDEKFEKPVETFPKDELTALLEKTFELLVKIEEKIS